MVYVNLRADSVSGTVLGTSQSVTMPDSFGLPTFSKGYVDFLFSTSVTVHPGTQYFFQPVLQSGDAWGILNDTFNYGGGTAILAGNESPTLDQWFREGLSSPSLRQQACS